MGSGSGYKTQKVIRALESLARIHAKVFIFERASKEGHKIKPVFGDGFSFPVPTKHSTINMYIVEATGKKLEKMGVCTKEDFLKMVK